MASSDHNTQDVNLDFRVSTAQRMLIDRAAATLGKARAQFILETMCETSQNILLDRNLLKLDDEAMSAFEAMLNKQSGDSAALGKTLSAPAPWDK